MKQILDLTFDDKQGNVLLQLWDEAVHVFGPVAYQGSIFILLLSTQLTFYMYGAKLR